MAKIKTFQGSGPNPNVPFSQIPDARAVGNTERALGNLAGQVTNISIQYQKDRQRQIDTSAVAEATKEKSIFLKEARAKLQNEDGTYNIDELQKSIEEYDGFYKKKMSSDAYDVYSQRQASVNEHELGRLNNENLKITRESSMFKTEDALSGVLNSSIEGSLEDKQSAFELASTIAQDAVASGVYTPKEAQKLLEEKTSSYSKNYLKGLLKSREASDFAVAEAFVKLDPFKYYSKNAGLKIQAMNEVAKAKDDFRTDADTEFIRSVRKQEAKTRAVSMQKKNGYVSNILASIEQGTFDDVYSESLAGAREDYLSGNMTETDFNNIKNLSPKLEAQKDEILRSEMFASEDPRKAYSQMSDFAKDKYKKDFERASNSPGAFKDAKKMFEAATKEMFSFQGNQTQTLLERNRLNSAFMDNISKVSTSNKKISNNIVILKTVRDNLDAKKYDQFFKSQASDLYLRLVKSNPNIDMEQVNSFLNKQMSELDSIPEKEDK